MKRYLTFIALSMILASCQFGFEVNNSAAPGLYVNCMSDESSISFIFEYAVHLGVRVDEIPGLKMTNIELSVNGEAVDVDSRILSYEKALGRKLEAGDRLEIRAIAEGLPEIEASTVMPALPEFKSLSLVKENASGVRVSGFTLELASQPVPGSYVGVMLQKRMEIEMDGQWRDSSRFLSPSVTVSADPSAEVARVNFRGMRAILPTVRSGDRMQILSVIPASAFKDCKISLTDIDMSALMHAASAGGTGPGSPLPAPPEERSVSYELRLLGVSEDFYRYSVAMSRVGTDFLAQMGLAPAQFAWTNVRGGFGVCGAFVFDSFQFEEKEILLHN